MGTPSLAVVSLRALAAAGTSVSLAVTQVARPAGRGRRETAPPVARAAAELGILHFQPDRIRDPDAVERLASEAPDVIVVVAYGQILPPAVLTIPRLGCINVHLSLLPRHRGASPVSGAILAGDEVTGVTIMLMDEGMDTGPIVAQRETPIAPEDDEATLRERLAALGADLLVETLPNWGDGRITSRPQDHARATVTRKVKREDALLNWGHPAIHLWQRIRAYAEWPQGHTFWEGKRLRIRTAAVDDSASAEPGLVIPWGPRTRSPSAVAIGTGQGVLVPKTLGLEGRQVVPIGAFLAGHPTFIGSHLPSGS
ncbi:MAG: methionyl-tRNA formyltransferase [Chloroflexi bacterium]|nr:methionyl-tRNA formyltransferase [Chloroflexota bacterium]